MILYLIEHDTDGTQVSGNAVAAFRKLDQPDEQYPLNGFDDVVPHGADHIDATAFFDHLRQIDSVRSGIDARRFCQLTETPSELFRSGLRVVQDIEPGLISLRDIQIF